VLREGPKFVVEPGRGFVLEGLRAKSVFRDFYLFGDQFVSILFRSFEQITLPPGIEIEKRGRPLLFP
jgi:hypothetical protein